jgi:H+/Cl- antiporter ClcA
MVSIPPLNRLRQFPTLAKQHRYGFTLLAFISAAVITGVVCVMFMWSFDYVFAHQLDFQRLRYWCFLTSPLLLLGSAELIRRCAPYASGSGIPQVIFAASHFTPGNERALFSLISPFTFLIKIAALLLALWGGASVGREGPTVHIATCVFVTLMVAFRKWFGLTFDMRSAIVAGGAAGLAAAFNTPLAGVTFAIEELSSDYFSSIKDYVVMAIIFASLATLSLTGDYGYFGRLQNPSPVPIADIIFIGVVGGVLGALFSTGLIWGHRFFAKSMTGKSRYTNTILFAWAVLILALIAGIGIMGPGNTVAQVLLEGHQPIHNGFFPFAKILATLFTYWAGVAGGIFAPCLSVGASLGALIGSQLGLATAGCALVGMAAFLSGAVQAPITTFVIIFEMTGDHDMLVPVMLAALVSFMVARLLKAEHLYPTLSETYRSLLNRESPATIPAA